MGLQDVQGPSHKTAPLPTRRNEEFAPEELPVRDVTRRSDLDEDHIELSRQDLPNPEPPEQKLDRILEATEMVDWTGEDLGALVENFVDPPVKAPAEPKIPNFDDLLKGLEDLANQADKLAKVPAADQALQKILGENPAIDLAALLDTSKPLPKTTAIKIGPTQPATSKQSPILADALSLVDHAYKNCTKNGWSLDSQLKYLAAARHAVAAYEKEAPDDPYLNTLRQLKSDIALDVKKLQIDLDPHSRMFKPHSPEALGVLALIKAARADLASQRSGPLLPRGGQSPEEFQPRIVDVAARQRQLDLLEEVVKQREPSESLLSDIASKVKGIGSGHLPEQPDAYVLDLAFRARFGTKGPLGSPYPDTPEGKAAIRQVNTMESLANNEKELEQDYAKKRAKVGRPGGMDPATFMQYEDQIHDRLENLQQLKFIVFNFTLAPEQLRDIKDRGELQVRRGGQSADPLADNFPLWLKSRLEEFEHSLPLLWIPPAKVNTTKTSWGPNPKAQIGGTPLTGKPLSPRSKEVLALIDRARANLESEQARLRDLKGSLNPIEVGARTLDFAGRLRQLDLLKQVVTQQGLSDTLLNEIDVRANNLGSHRGPAIEEADAFVLDLAFRGHFQLAGPLGSLYPDSPEGKAAIQQVNTMESLAQVERELADDFTKRSANVGRMGGMSVTEFMVYEARIQNYQEHLGQLKSLLFNFPLSAEQSREIKEHVNLLLKPGAGSLDIGSSKMNRWMENLRSQLKASAPNLLITSPENINRKSMVTEHTGPR